MREFFRGKTPSVKVFNLPSKYNMADMLRADCKAAGINYEDDGQPKIDFHSLRHTTGSLLAASGVHPKIAQSIMRHSDINLTMSRYTHIPPRAGITGHRKSARLFKSARIKS